MNKESYKFIERILPPIIILSSVILGWEVAVRIFDIPPWLLPAPSSVFMRFFTFETLLYHTSLTLVEALSGFAISAVLGITLSAFIVHSKFLERGLLPYIVISNSIPIIAIVPILTIWFGFGISTKIVIASIISFFPIVTNTTRGLRSADPRILDFMRTINATRREVFLKVQFPSALPFIFAAFKIAGTLSLIGAVVAEFYGADRGLGYILIISAYQLRTDLMFVTVIVLATIGVSLFTFFGKIESYFAHRDVEVEKIQ